MACFPGFWEWGNGKFDYRCLHILIYLFDSRWGATMYSRCVAFEFFFPAYSTYVCVNDGKFFRCSRMRPGDIWPSVPCCSNIHCLYFIHLNMYIYTSIWQKFMFCMYEQEWNNWRFDQWYIFSQMSIIYKYRYAYIHIYLTKVDYIYV